MASLKPEDKKNSAVFGIFFLFLQSNVLLMKNTVIFLLSFLFILFGCNSNNDKINEGILTYSIDYPSAKNNLFLYHVLPKELKTSFKNNRMELKIEKANMENTILVDNKKHRIAAYYNYGEVFSTNLTSSEIETLLKKQKTFEVKFTSKKDTLLGFTIHQAFVFDPKNPKVKSEVWYTKDIGVKNPNWFTEYRKIPGVLMKYSTKQYGLEMKFKASTFKPQAISDSIVMLERPGEKITHAHFDEKIADIFNSFK